MVLLAVYGTLKQGHHNHSVHLDREPEFSGTVELKAEMYTNGRYPMLVKSDRVRSIYVEIYDVNDEELQAIDGLEEPFGYHREEVSFAGYDDVWVYYFTSGDPPAEFRFVESGNFVKEVEW